MSDIPILDVDSIHPIQDDQESPIPKRNSFWVEDFEDEKFKFPGVLNP